MASEVGTAFVSVVPSTRGFGSLLGRQVNRPISATGAASGGLFGRAFAGGFGAIGVGLAALGIGKIVKDSVSLEADFSQTMNTLAAVTNTPKTQIKQLSDLALKMGRDTVFSASEAATAMLELAKGGLTTAQIKGGALASTMTLAAAAGTDLASAATILSNSMNIFGLSAKDTPKITAALAGGANASTASMESLGFALQQGGLGAHNAGLSVQEAVAVLAAFDNAGLKGSDAGTSMKTMFTRLIPQTDKAAGAMRDLGVKFTDARGNFLPIVKIAEQLHKQLGPLKDDAKTRFLNKIFGSDASRAASVLADLGGNGLKKYIRATNDAGAANRVAKARMSGTAGALEQLRGSVETAKLRLGQLFAPIVQKGALLLTRAINGVVTGFRAFISSPIAGALAGALVPAAVIASFTALSAAISLIGLLLSPILLIAAPLALLGGALASVLKESAPLRGAVKGIASAFKQGGLSAAIEQVGTALEIAFPLIKAKLAEWGQAFVDWIKPKIPPMLAALGRFLQRVGAWIGSTGWPLLKAKFALWGTALVAWIKPRIPPMLAALGQFLQRIGVWIGTVGLPRLLGLLNKWGTALIAWIKPRIPPALAALGGFLRRIGAWLLSVGLPRLVGLLGRLGTALVGWITPRIPGMLHGLGRFVGKLIGFLALLAPRIAVIMVVLGAKLIKALVTSLITNRATIGTFFLRLPGRILRFTVGFDKVLFKAGVALIKGLIGGIVSQFSGVKDKLQGLTGKLTSWKGPASTDKKILHKPGQLLIQGFMAGITSQTPALQKQLRGLTDTLPGEVGFGIRAGHRRGARRADVRRPGTSGGDTFIIHNPREERASESVEKTLRRKKHRAGWATA